jgi:hypothetical protein
VESLTCPIIRPAAWLHYGIKAAACSAVWPELLRRPRIADGGLIGVTAANNARHLALKPEAQAKERPKFPSLALQA